MKLEIEWGGEKGGDLTGLGRARGEEAERLYKGQNEQGEDGP